MENLSELIKKHGLESVGVGVAYYGTGVQVYLGSVLEKGWVRLIPPELGVYFAPTVEEGILTCLANRHIKETP